MTRSTTTANNAGGMSIAGLLGVVFIVLKLTHVIAWSWWLVLAPFWIPALIGVVAFIVIVVVAVVKS